MYDDPKRKRGKKWKKEQKQNAIGANRSLSLNLPENE